VSISKSTGVLWRHAGFMRLWAAQAISTFGARIARTGLPLAAVLTIHARPAEVGLLAALATAPELFVGLFAGGFVDRSRRRPIMISADLVRAAVLLMVPLAAVFHLLSMVELYIAAALVGAASALFGIADHAYLPSLLPRQDLVEGNAKLAVTESISEIGGPALAGILVQILTAPIAIGLNALTYLGSAALLAIIRAEEVSNAETRRRNRWHHDIGAGLRVILGSPLVRPLFVMAIISPLFGGFFAALYTIFAIQVLGLSATMLGITIGVGGVGALLGASASPALCRRFGLGPTIAVGFFASAMSAFFVPLASGSMALKVTMLMAAQLFGDSLAVAAIIPSSSLRQTVLPAGMLGRTAALFQAGAGASAVVGAVLGGLLGELLGVRTALFIAAGGTLAVTTIGLLSPLMDIKDSIEPTP
jgi:Na+/melibiose symporter-like transporter